VATLVVFVLVCLAWVFFRATGFAQALQIIGIMFDFGHLNVAAARELIGKEHSLLVLVVALRQLYFYLGLDRLSWRWPEPVRVVEPVALAVRAIRYSSRPGENVLDLFGGSGPTLIACEQTDRRCFMMELDPLYCDVIVQRWEKLTGRKAERMPVCVTAVRSSSLSAGSVSSAEG
jgi:DNA modification methylase